MPAHSCFRFTPGLPAAEADHHHFKLPKIRYGGAAGVEVSYLAGGPLAPRQKSDLVFRSLDTWLIGGQGGTTELDNLCACLLLSTSRFGGGEWEVAVLTWRAGTPGTATGFASSTTTETQRSR